MTDTIPTSLGEYQDKQAEIRAAKEAMAGPVPIIPDAMPNTVTLPRGLYHNGIWHRQVTVRELTGVDEEALAKVKEPSEFFDAVLAQGVDRIGDTDLSAMTVTTRQGYLRQLLMGEREQIFLGIVQATYGNQRKLTLTCNACQTKQEVTFTLSEDFKPKDVGEVSTTPYTFTTSKGGVLQYRLAIGEDQIEILRHKGSMAEASTILLSRCLTQVNGEVIVDPMSFARNLPMRDRSALLDLMSTKQPSIDLDSSVACVGCGEEQQITLGWADLFRP